MRIVFSALLFFTIIICFFATLTKSALHPDELKALGEIATTLGTKLDLSDGDPCDLKTLNITHEVDVAGKTFDRISSIVCECFNNSKTCHITELTLKSFSLPGKLPRALVKLQYLRSIELCRNYLSGTIPMEWASMQYLNSVSLCGNNLSGNLPTGLQNFKNLTFLGVEANQFSGNIPDELGNLTNLQKLQLGSNQFTGSLPSTLARLVNLTDFRVNDNNFNGTIPGYIGNWPRLEKLFLYASGLKGPIPEAVARLEKLKDVRISDTTEISSFPVLSSKNITTLILRNVSLSGSIPAYIWNMSYLKYLDLSFNKLTGEIPRVQNTPEYTYLTGNMLSGDIDSVSFLNGKDNIDLSYNNFSWRSSCRDTSNINTYRSSYLKNLTGLLPCAGPINCTRYQRFLHINCGGDNVTITNSSHQITYEADNNNDITAAKYLRFQNWGISNTGHFTDDDNDNYNYIISNTSILDIGKRRAVKKKPLWQKEGLISKETLTKRLTTNQKGEMLTRVRV